ncbi:MAG: histidine kinase dimerization/phosphoacceptor domain -containing protein [Polaribacter sp.]|uniref:histidine kinase dimerization/phosphoacceptor domain -containing protein n=1 Tax=Polaribacter sp. TaxID=1920175 RepID=UPI0032670488
MLHLIFKIKIIFIVFTFLGLQIPSNTIQKKIKSFTEKDFNSLNKKFNERVILFNQKKIRLKKTFIDSLFIGEEWALKNGTPNQKLLAKFQIFTYYNQLINNDKIIELGTDLLQKEEFFSFHQSYITALGLIEAYHRKGFYNKELEIFPLFIKLNNIHNSNKNKPYYEYERVARIYYKIKDYKKARENYKLKLDVLLKEESFFSASSTYNNIGLTYERQYDYKNAIKNYNKSLELVNKVIKKNLEDNLISNLEYKIHFKNVIASNIASLNIKSLNFKGAEEIFLNELKSSKKVIEPRITVQAYLNLSEYYLLNKKDKLCEKYLDSSLNFLKSFKTPIATSRAYAIKGKYLLYKNKFKKSHYYFVKSARIKDSINQSVQKKGIKEASLEFNLNETQKELQFSKKIISHNQKINFYHWLIIIITSLTGVLFFFLFLKIKRKNKYITINKKKLTKALKVNQTLLKEIHHRIKNNLQVISGILELKSQNFKSDVNKEVFLETQKYIESMAFIHEHLYTQDSNSVIEMTAYLKKLSNAIIKNYNNQLNIDVTVKINNVVMTTEKATPLGLIVCELITNSAKHAFKNNGKIKIVLEKKGNIYYFHYKDNGKGFNLKSTTKKEQIGLNLIEMLIEELNCKSYSYLDNGFNLKFNFS